MAEKAPNNPDDIQGILSDLDAILSGLGGADESSPVPAPPPPPKSADLPKPVAPPKIIEPPKVVEPPKMVEPPPKAVEPPPKAVEPPPKAVEPPPKAVEPPPKAVEPPPKAVEPPRVDVPVANAPAAASDIPEKTPKDQIRRVAYVHTLSCAEVRAGFATFLSQAARTISKKPIFLREVVSLEVSNSSDPNAVFDRIRQTKAVALLAVVDGWPQAKIEELSEACARGSVLFRAVPSGDVQKKATAVDIIVDMMLLPGES